MILVICPSLSIDVTYRLGSVGQQWSFGSHRAREHWLRPGGKGSNVARVISSLGHACTVIGFIGGSTGEMLANELARWGVDVDCVPVDAANRVNVTVLADANAWSTVNAPAPEVPHEDWERLLDKVSRTVQAGGVTGAAISGSFPGRTPEGVIDRLVKALEPVTTVWVDTSGAALLSALACANVNIKVNVDEAAAALTALDKEADGDARELALALGSMSSATCVCVTDGPRGAAYAVGTSARTVTAGAPPEPAYSVGAGDAFLAGLLCAGSQGMGLDDSLAPAIEIAQRSLATPVAGEFGDVAGGV